jgi:tRNA threonylcarbamoyladenosine biosynthesis protein TsaE
MNAINVPTLADWPPIVKDIVETIPQRERATVLALSGDLGAGKTTFVQQLAKYLGVTEPVTSPTFTILKRYETNDKKFTTLFHMDAYRLESEAELEPLQFSELFDLPNTIICIEWAEKIQSALPAETHYFQLAIDENHTHTIQKVS